MRSLSRRKFLRNLAAGAASVAIGMRLSQGMPALVDGDGYEYTTHKMGFTITEELVDEGLYEEGLGERMAEALAKSINSTKENVAVRVFMDWDGEPGHEWTIKTSLKGARRAAG